MSATPTRTWQIFRSCSRRLQASGFSRQVEPRWSRRGFALRSLPETCDLMPWELRLPNHPNFRFQLDTQSLIDLLADVVDQLHGLLRRTAPEVYEVVGMDWGDLDTGDPGTFQAGGLYHAAWEVSRRTLEGGAAARPVGGAVHALSSELLYAGLQLRRVAGGERISCPQDDPVGVIVQCAVTV